ATKCRMAEYQAAILLMQMQTVEEQVSRRSENAAYLTSKLREIPGIVPRADYPEVTHTAFYYYGFRYKKEKFGGLSRDRLLAALDAEGIPASKGLGVIESRPMNKEGLLQDAFASKAYQKIYSREKLANYPAENECPESDQLCEETVGFHQRVLLGTKQDMDDICNAVLKIYENHPRLLEPLK
ncbi:DegT/DnrJ/EryC1/StrS family aminotransferase, partial [Candidatus Sumerlaeota bacterium]|nr:DegT/DnrJ/EryC1/StrS family aminotransferase [Candidatus Sumerlaeota bacterium]